MTHGDCVTNNHFLEYKISYGTDACAAFVALAFEYACSFLSLFF